jgi:hypothetical protein
LKLLGSIGLGHLAARIIITARPSEILKTVSLQTELGSELVKTIPLYRKGASKYRRLFSLMHHIQELSVGDLFQYAEVRVEMEIPNYLNYSNCTAFLSF